MLLLHTRHSGTLVCLALMTEDVMVSACYAATNLVGLIKTINFVMMTSSNMLAATNLGICINLALIVSSHRTMTRVKTVSSPRVLFIMLLVSASLAAATVPLWETTVVLGTHFWFTNSDPVKNDFIIMSIYIIEFLVGICMLVIVFWLAMFRMTEIKECWRFHSRIRYYFCLTLFGTAVNLGLGICGAAYVFGDRKEPLPQIWSWLFRYIHISFDTLVLYGALREGSIDERAEADRSSQDGHGHNASGLARNGELSSKPGRSGRYEQAHRKNKLATSQDRFV
ncbi:unnamed protein product [Ectocarpus sp. CCAP 1310/34]|nr:unnamed protein product [Ectocarpus sp. CCAP 1310/34]